MSLLVVDGLKVHYPARLDWRGRPRAWVRAVDGVGLEVLAGETLGLVGESGCGKSTLGRAIVRLETPTAGTIRFNGEDLAGLEGAALRRARRGLQMIFQDPYGSLDPRWTVGQAIGEGIDIHGLIQDDGARRERIRGLLQDVGLEPGVADRYPHEFSGGQRQRIGIARALAVEPKLIVCDEPVSALDVSVQAQVVNLLQALQQSRGIAYLFIAHDLAVVEHLSHRVAVMYLGRLMELGPSRTVCGDPLHPYTKALLSSVPEPGVRRRERMILQGDVPSPLRPPAGCPFHPRCPVAVARCQSEVPEFRMVAPGRSVACHQVASGG